VIKWVFILGNRDDDHAMHVAERLAACGMPVGWLDGNQFPVALRTAFEPGTGGYLISDDGSKVPFDEVESVYWRCFRPPPDPALPNAEQADLAYEDSRSLFESLLIDMPARWINGWNGFQLHQRKPAALARVWRLGLQGIRLPETLHTNDPEAVTAFAERFGRCVYKPVQGGAHARRLTPDLLTTENLENLRHAPVTIQEEIEGTDVRVFIAGRRLLACELRTDALDFRDDPNSRIERVELPRGISSDCRKIARQLDLVWTGIDLRRTPSHAYYYFEANPSPMFLGFESRCDLPVTAALIDLLVGAD